MNWEAIGAIAEAVGALAVVVTLGYLAVQMRQNTRSVRANVEQQIAGSISVSLNSASSTGISTLWIKAIEGLDKLSEDEIGQLGFFLLAYLKQFEQAFIQYRSGNLSEASWEALDWQFRATVMSSKGAQHYWHLRQDAFHKMFRDYVNGIPTDDTSTGLNALQLVKDVKESGAD